MAYAIARAHLDGGGDLPEVIAAAENFCRQKVPGMLADGLYPNVARWMKIVYWNDREVQPTAADALRTCLEFLPEEHRG